MNKNQTSLSLLDSEDSINQFINQISQSKRIGIDTEFMRIRTYYPILCLIQISSDYGTACIDCLTDSDLSEVWKLIYNPKIKKILHSGRQDLEIFYLLNKKIPKNIFDTQVAASFIGYPSQVGIKTLLKSELDVDIDKTETRSDWTQRPLNQKQINYALEDVLYLNQLFEQIESKLIKNNRLDWALEDSQNILTDEDSIFNPKEAWKRIKSIKRLNKKHQSLAIDLSTWREEKSIEKNIPRQWLIKDKLLLEIAKTKVRPKNIFNHIEGRTNLSKSGIHEISEVIEKNKQESKLGKESFKIQKDKNYVRPDVFETLINLIMNKAKLLELPQETLGSKKDLIDLISKNGGRLSSGWRNNIIGRELMKTIQS